jgi:AraC-like DNA-binding protein
LVIDSEKFLQKGKLIQVRTHTRFVHFPKHRHNYVEVIYMCKGSTTHIIDGNEVVLEEGDLLFLNQNATQEIMPAGKDDIAINFIILPQFFDMAFEMIGADENLLRDFVVGSLCEDSRRTSYLYFHVADVLPIQNLMENMIWSLLNNQPNKRSSNQLTMGLLFLHLINHIEKMETGGKAYHQEFEVTVLNYVETHYKDGSLSELAELMGYNIYWLSREIKKRTGKTYKELVQTKRMNQAAYMLANSRVSVSEIIQMVGYDNSSYFHRKFKERFGTSPKEYRNSL